MSSSRYVATIPNFTPAAGDYIIPNSDTVTSNFVLQGDNTGGGTWVTIPVTEYELFAKSGYIAQRVSDLTAGTAVDWSSYESTGSGLYRLHAYTKSVSGTRTTYADQTVTFAQDSVGYSPIGQVGDINGEAIKNIIVNFVVAGGGDVVINDDGLTLQAGQATSNTIKWVSGAETPGLIWSDFGSHTSLLYLASQGEANTGFATTVIEATGTSGYNNARYKLDSYATTYGTVDLRGWTWGQVYGGDLTKFGFLVGGTDADQPSSLLHLKSTAPTFRMEDSTASAKSLVLTVNANTALFEEIGGNDLLFFDLAGLSVVVGNAAVATNATDGFLYIPACAGTPTGTPTSYTGRAALVVDSTNNKMYIYSGAAWRALN